MVFLLKFPPLCEVSNSAMQPIWGDLISIFLNWKTDHMISLCSVLLGNELLLKIKTYIRAPTSSSHGHDDW